MNRLRIGLASNGLQVAGFHSNAQAAEGEQMQTSASAGDRARWCGGRDAVFIIDRVERALPGYEDIHPEPLRITAQPLGPT